MPNRAGCADTNYVNYNWGCWDNPTGEAPSEHPVNCYDCQGVGDGGDTSCCLTNFPKIWFSQFKSIHPSGNVDSYYSSTIFATVKKDGEVQGNRGPSDGIEGWNDDDGTIALENFNQDSPNPYDNPIVAVFDGFPHQKKHCCGIADSTGCTSEDTECAIKGLTPRFNHIGYTPNSADVDSGEYYNFVNAYNYQLYPANRCQEVNDENFVPDMMEGNYCDCQYSDTEGGPFPGSTYGGTCASGNGGAGFNMYGQWGCQFPWTPGPFNDADGDGECDVPGIDCFTHPSQVQWSQCSDPTGEIQGNVPCVTQCVKGFQGPPMVFQDVVTQGIDPIRASRWLNSDSTSSYPYPNIITGDMMYEIEVALAGVGSEPFTIKVYDPVENEFRIIGCATINGNNEDYGTPVEPVTFEYTSDGIVYGCTDIDASSCNYNCAANVDDGSCLYTDIHCSGECTPEGQTNQVNYYTDGDGDGRGCLDTFVTLCYGDDLTDYYTTTGDLGEEPCISGEVDSCYPPVLAGKCSDDGGITFPFDAQQCSPGHWKYGDSICLQNHGFGYTCEWNTDPVCNCVDDFIDDCNICGGDNDISQCVVGVGGGGSNLDCNCDCFGTASFNSCGVCGYWTEENNYGLPICYEDTDLDGIGGCIGTDADGNGYNTAVISGNCDGSCPTGFSLIGGDTSNPCNSLTSDPPCTCDPFNECPGNTHFVDECGYCAELGQEISPYMGCDGVCFGCPLCDQTDPYLGKKVDDCGDCMEMQCVKPCEDGIQTWICTTNDTFIEYESQSECDGVCGGPNTCSTYCDMTCYNQGGSYDDNIACNGNHMNYNPCSMFDDDGNWPNWIEYSPGLIPNNTDWNSACIDCANVPNGSSEYDITGEQNHYNCCLPNSLDECGVCYTAHGQVGGYIIEGTDNVDECPNDGGCSGPFYYSGPERWYPDTDLDNLAYGANYPLLQDGIGYCGRYEGGVLIPGSKPPATDAISNWIWFCPSEYLVTYGDVDTLGNCGTTGYPNCNEPFCNYDPHPDCTSNVVDECGICDGPGGGICGCGEQPPVPMVMDFDDNGIGYGYFWNNIWNNDNFLQACDYDLPSISSICFDSPGRTNPLWIQNQNTQDVSDIKHCTDPNSDSYYCLLGVGKCVCDYFVTVIESNPDDAGLPQNIIQSDPTQCIYLDFTYPTDNDLEVITQVDDIIFSWVPGDISGINDDSPWINGTISSLTYDASLQLEDMNQNEIYSSSITINETTHPSAIYSVDTNGQLPVGTYKVKLRWPSDCSMDVNARTCLGYAEQNFNIVEPIYGCRDDGTLANSNDPSGCCNQIKYGCTYVVDHWENLQGEIVDECKPACNYNPDANADGFGDNACIYRTNWYDDSDGDSICCAEPDTQVYACGPISNCTNESDLCEQYWDLAPDGWVEEIDCDGFETGVACGCPSNVFDDCGTCIEPCCGTGPDSQCIGFQSEQPLEMSWNYNGAQIIENPCSGDEIPGNPNWNLGCMGCSDPSAVNYNENGTIQCTGKCYQDPDEIIYWTEECDTNVAGAFVCPGRCSENILKPCLSDERCGDDGYCIFGWVDDPEGLYDNYFNVDEGDGGWDNQGQNCCCQYDRGCVDPLSPSFGYGCPNPETGCENDCSGIPVISCLFGFVDGGVPISSNVVVVNDIQGGDWIQVDNYPGQDSIPDLVNEVGSYIRINSEILQLNEIFQGEMTGQWNLRVSRALFETDIPEDGHSPGSTIYLENTTCNHNCCAHYNVSACMDINGQDYYCYGELPFPSIDNSICPDGIAPDTNWVTIVPCDFSTAQSVCEDNGWVNNGDGTYSNPEGIVVSLEDTANCCCEYKFDCANNLVTPDNYTDTAFIDSCGYCVGTGTENLDTILDTRRISSDQYVCGVNPSGGANVECTANWANTGCGCWHEEHSPGVINPRYVYTDNQSENAPETWPEGFEGQLAWYYNSDNDGYGCYLSYEGCSLGLYPEGSIIPYTEATCLSEGGVWDTMTGHTIKWQDFDATFQNELSFAYENGTSVRVYINGTFHDVPFGLCVNEYIQDGEIKSCFDEQSEDCNCDDVINFESTEEGRRANCSSYVYSYHKSDWHYCYEAPQNYIAPVCVTDNPIYWPAWMSNDNYDCGGPYWIGFEYDDTYAESHPLYPDMGDPCACTGSGSEDDFDAPYSGVDQVITDENAYATPGYYDCFGMCMGDGRRDACGVCYHVNSEEPRNSGTCFNGENPIGGETLRECCESSGATFDDQTGACIHIGTGQPVQYGDFGNGYSWRVSGDDVDCNGNCMWYTAIGRITGFNSCLPTEEIDDRGFVHLPLKYCAGEWVEGECNDWQFCDRYTTANAFLDDIGECSGGNSNHYPNKTSYVEHSKPWPFPFGITTWEMFNLHPTIAEYNSEWEYSSGKPGFYDFMKQQGGFPFYCARSGDNTEFDGNIHKIPGEFAPMIPVLPWNNYPGVDSNRDYMVYGAGIWGGPDLDCSCTSTIGVSSSEQAKVKSNLSWTSLSGHHNEQSNALKCCASGNEGMPGYESEEPNIPYNCGGISNESHPNYHLYHDDIEQGCFYNAYIPNADSTQLVGGMTCGCTGGSTNKFDDYCVGCAIENGCPSWDPDCEQVEEIEARNLNEPCNNGENVYINGGHCGSINTTSECNSDPDCQWSDIMLACYPAGEHVDYPDWSGGACLIDDGSCDYCECGFDVNWDPSGNYTVNVLLPLMCNVSGECPTGSFCTGCKCVTVPPPNVTGNCVDVSNYYPKCGSFRGVNSYDLGCGDGMMRSEYRFEYGLRGNDSQWQSGAQWYNSCWWVPSPKETYGCSMPFANIGKTSGATMTPGGPAEEWLAIDDPDYNSNAYLGWAFLADPDSQGNFSIGVHAALPGFQSGRAPVYSYGDDYHLQNYTKTLFKGSGNYPQNKIAARGPCTRSEYDLYYYNYDMNCNTGTKRAETWSQCTSGAGLLGPTVTSFSNWSTSQHGGNQSYSCSNPDYCRGAQVGRIVDGSDVNTPMLGTHKYSQNYSSPEHYSLYGWAGMGHCQYAIDNRGDRFSTTSGHLEYWDRCADWVSNTGVYPGSNMMEDDCDWYNNTPGGVFSNTCAGPAGNYCTEDDINDIYSTGCSQTYSGMRVGSPYIHYARGYAQIKGGQVLGCGYGGNGVYCPIGPNDAPGITGHNANVTLNEYVSGPTNNTACLPLSRVTGLSTGGYIPAGSNLKNLYKNGDTNTSSTFVVNTHGAQYDSGNTGCSAYSKTNCTVGYSSTKTKAACQDAHSNSETYYTSDTVAKRVMYLGVPTDSSTRWDPKIDGSQAFGKSGLQNHIYTNYPASGGLNSSNIINNQVYMGLSSGVTTHRPDALNACPEKTTLMEEGTDADGNPFSVFIASDITVDGDFYSEFQNCYRGWWCTSITTSPVTGVTYKSCPTRNNTGDNKSWPWYDCLAYRCYQLKMQTEGEGAVIECIRNGMVETGEWPDWDGEHGDMGLIVDSGVADDQGDPEDEQVFGCTDPGACNYNQNANVNDGSCDYESCQPIPGAYVNFRDSGNGWERSCCDTTCFADYYGYEDYTFSNENSNCGACYNYDDQSAGHSCAEDDNASWASYENKHKCCAYHHPSTPVAVPCDQSSSGGSIWNTKSYACESLYTVTPSCTLDDQQFPLTWDFQEIINPMNAGWVDDCQSCCEFMYQHLYMWAQFSMGEIVNAGCDWDAIQRSLTIWGGEGSGWGGGIFEYNNCHHKCTQNHGYGIGSHVFCNY